MQNCFFTVRNMTVGYDGIPLIRDIGLSLKRGEILTLIGPNGAGKSTILKSLIGQLELLSGKIVVGDFCLNGMPEMEYAKRMSAVLTERVHPELMTCEDVVSLGRYPYTGRLGILSEKDKKIVRETMELVHISDLAQREFLTLSDGQRQRVMLARAIAQEPEVLVLDEPTSFLDIRYKLEFLSSLQEMTREKKLTVVMSLHELDLAERISDRILCVKGEYVERFGTPDEVFVPGYISSLYGIAQGSFDEQSGRVELPAAPGQARAFVIAGNGSGTPVYRRLQRNGIPFSTGILWENDRDMTAARALSGKVFSEAAFCAIKRETVEAAKREIDRCETVLCALADFGEWNRENGELRDYAEKAGKLSEGESLWQR